MEEIIKKLKSEAQNLIKSAKEAGELEDLRIRFLGRQDGEVTRVLRSLKDLSEAEKRKIGPLAQKLKNDLEALLQEKLEFLKKTLRQKPLFDLTMPGKKVSLGHLHPLTIVEKEIREIFKAMNFSAVEGPEAETEYYNFDALNIPKDHPARDMWDTFWLKRDANLQIHANDANRLLLRTHTSPVQIRYMKSHKPPFQIIVPGRVFRYEATDASHETNFHQVEGLMVGKDVNLANFKFVIQEFFRRLFKKNLQIRLRPSYFPFVEPGLEVDVECVKCGMRTADYEPAHANDGMRTPEQSSMRKAYANEYCPVCKGTRWLEVMGAGMVHPRIFEAARYNPRDLQGFAFGLGLERIAMIKYNIPDIRLFYSGDLRFIKQF